VRQLFPFNTLRPSSMPDPSEIRLKIFQQILRRFPDCLTEVCNSIVSQPHRLFVISYPTKFRTLWNVGTSIICRLCPESIAPCELPVLPAFRRTTPISTEIFPLVRATTVTIANPARTFSSATRVHLSLRNQGPSS
jgi:hypothetical protein